MTSEVEVFGLLGGLDPHMVSRIGETAGMTARTKPASRNRTPASQRKFFWSLLRDDHQDKDDGVKACTTTIMAAMRARGFTAGSRKAQTDQPQTARQLYLSETSRSHRLADPSTRQSNGSRGNTHFPGD